MSVYQYQRRDLPWTTVSPSDLSALDIGDVNATDFRAKQWWERSDSIFEQAVQNDEAFLAWAEMFGGESLDLKQPILNWRVGRPEDLHTTNDAAIAAADTYIELDDSYVALPGFMLSCIQYGAEYRVLDVDHDHSESWTNDAASACNVQVERLSGPSVAIPAGQYLNTTTAPMGELGTPSRIGTTVPGDPVWNTMMMIGLYGSISNLQRESDMIGDWGTHPKIRDDIWYQHRMGKQFAILFGHRWFGTDTQAAQGQMYLSAGIVAQIKSHIMEAGSLGINLTWPKLNDFWELTYDSLLSSPTKTHFCGSAQFRDIRKTARDHGVEMEMLGVQSGADNKMSIGANTMRLQLESGKAIEIVELRKAFGNPPNLADWGITCDAGNFALGAYGNISEVWYENIETPAQAITLRSDALVDTWLPAIKDESTFAVIRGGTRGLIER